MTGCRPFEARPKLRFRRGTQLQPAPPNNRTDKGCEGIERYDECGHNAQLDQVGVEILVLRFVAPTMPRAHWGRARLAFNAAVTEYYGDQLAGCYRHFRNANQF